MKQLPSILILCFPLLTIGAVPPAQFVPPQPYQEDSKEVVLKALQSPGQPGAPYADGLLMIGGGGALDDQQRAFLEARATALIEAYRESDDREIKLRALQAMSNGGLFAHAAVRAKLAELGAEICTTSNDGQMVAGGVKLISLRPEGKHVDALMAAITRNDYIERSFTPWESVAMVRSNAVSTLARAGEPAIPALTNLFDNADMYGVSKLDAAVALCRAGSRARIRYILDAAGLGGGTPSPMAIMYLPYTWPFLTVEEKDQVSQLMEKLLKHDDITVRSMAARWALKCDKERFAERIRALSTADASDDVKKNARDALMEAGLIEKDEGTALADQVQKFFQQRRSE